MGERIEFLLLGPLEARHRQRPLRLGSIKHRMLLAKLLLHANQVVSTDELIDTVWGDDPPTTVRQSLQNHVAALRKALDPEKSGAGAKLLITKHPGYQLDIHPDQVDLTRFEALAADGRQALADGDPTRAAQRLREALSLWRGAALTDVAAAASVTADGLAWPELVGIEELRVAAMETRIEADLALGRHHELVGELESLIGRYPLREQLHGQLMLALYRSGRQAESLNAYRDARHILVDELGIEPSTALQRLEQAILVQDPALELLTPTSTSEPEPEPAAARAPERPARPAAAPSDERKLVTVLFCDVDEPLDDSGERDPEDVSNMLARHQDVVRAQVDIFSGTIEHQVGGTTMAVFGVPRTREDDPERAVRAALAIREALQGGSDGLQLRIAVTTGEALVRAGEGPGRLAGDIVTTGARLQQVAPAGTVLVSEATERATERAISYGPGSLLSLGGRAKPLLVWSALEPRNRSSLDLGQAAGTPFVGRGPELQTLLDTFEQVRARKTPELATLLGPPGIGKTRLVAELGRAVEADPELVAWRLGRGLPYSEGMTFWALAEIVKAEAGILDTDSSERVERKLTQAARHALPTDPAAATWVAGHLRLLVGGGVEHPSRGDRQEEALAAWRRFFFGLAAQRPMVLVVEDLHWADDALLDFLDSLVDPATVERAGPAALLVVATARPRLLERRPHWTAGDREGARRTVHLGPLSEEHTGMLLESLLSRHGYGGAIDPVLLARVAGNPLFAEEYVRMLRDRGGADQLQPAAVAARPSDSQADVPLPETVHAIIAARLDALSFEDKAVLQDAAVLGRSGWAGALAAVGEHNRDELNARLADLERREFVRWLRRSTVGGEREFEFRHILVRDVAYGQIPRVERAGKHQRAAEWLSGLTTGAPEGASEGKDRTADKTELIAHHYESALTFAKAAGRENVELKERAAHALRDAGDRAAALGVHVTAARYYTKALDLWWVESPERPELELRAGKALCLGEGRGEELIGRARDALLAAGDKPQAAEAEALLIELAYLRGSGEREAHVERALELVADAPPSRSKAAVLYGCMRSMAAADRLGEATEIAEEALKMAEALDLSDLVAASLEVIGVAKVSSGRPEGVEDLERCIAISDGLNSPRSCSAYLNLASAYSLLGDLPRCFDARAKAKTIAERFGLARRLRWIALEQVAEHYYSGRWDDATRAVDALVTESSAGARHYMECECRIWRGRISMARGDTEAALDDAAYALALAHESGDPQNIDPALAFQARALLGANRQDEAKLHVDQLLQGLGGKLLKFDIGIDLAVALVTLGYPAATLDRDLIPSRWLAATQAFVAGDPRRSADIYAQVGSRPDEAYARLEAARFLFTEGKADEASAELDSALAFYREVGANAYVSDAEALRLAVV